MMKTIEVAKYVACDLCMVFVSKYPSLGPKMYIVNRVVLSSCSLGWLPINYR